MLQHAQGCPEMLHAAAQALVGCAGTYDGIAMHPYEVVFLKASWHVGEPHLSHYTKWVTAHANGEPGTHGSFDEPMYRYGVSLEAQEPNKAAEGFKVI